MSTDVFFGIALAAAIVGLVVYRLKYKRSPGVMNIVLLIAAILLAWFTVKMIQIYLAYGAIPDTLVNCVFLALTGEAGIMGWIKTRKEKYRERRWQKEDQREAEQAAKAALGDPMAPAQSSSTDSGKGLFDWH